MTHPCPDCGQACSCEGSKTFNVYMPVAGTVIQIESRLGSGYTVVLRTLKGKSIRLFYLANFFVHPGQSISAGQAVGEIYDGGEFCTHWLTAGCRPEDLETNLPEEIEEEA